MITKITPSNYVQCINADQCVKIKVGNTYPVHKESSSMYDIILPDTTVQEYYKHRFKEIINTNTKENLIIKD